MIQPMSRTLGTPSRTAAPDWLALDQQLCFALYAASLAMTKAYKPLLAPLGLTYPQYLVMLVLWEGDGIAVSQLGERLTLDSGTLTPLLKRLEALALLQRLRDVADERRVLLQLTPAGRALRAQAVAVPQAIACATACDLQQISALAAQLHQLRRQLQDTLSPTAAPQPGAAAPPRP
jgi:MarR family transcriptional regulator, organic hydroperoxide resistance regulator